MSRIAALLLLAGVLCAGEDEEQLLDLRPQWTAGETYERSFKLTLELKGTAARGSDRRRVVIRYEENCGYLDRILDVASGKPVHLRRTYDVYDKTVRVLVDGEPVRPPQPPAELAGKTLTLTVNEDGSVRASDPAAAAIDSLILPLDGVAARQDVRVGESWEQEAPVPFGTLRSSKLKCTVLRVMKYRGHPAVKVKVALSAETGFEGGSADLTYRGYLYFATDIRKPLHIDLKGPATLDLESPVGRLKGTTRIVADFKPRAERVAPEPRPKQRPKPRTEPGAKSPQGASPAVPAESTADTALLRARWKVGERSTVEIEIIDETRVSDNGEELMRSVQKTSVAYEETVTDAGPDAPRALQRRYTRHTKTISARMPSATLPPTTERHPIEGRTFTFVPENEVFAPTEPLPKSDRLAEFDGPLAGADWELALPGRTVKVGETWRPPWRTHKAFGSLRVRGMRLTLKAVNGDTAYIGIEQTRLRRKPGSKDPFDGDLSWEESGVMEFSLRHGKVLRVEVAPPPLDDETLGGTVKVRTTRTMR